MSPNKFVSLPDLILSRSLVFLLLITCLHLIAFISLFAAVYVHISVNIILGLLVGASFYYNLQYYKNLSMLKTIRYRRDGMWVLGYKVKSLLVSLEPEYLITEWLIVLRFKSGQTKRKTILIFYDMLSNRDFKQLRVVLPYIVQAKKKTLSC